VQHIHTHTHTHTHHHHHNNKIPNFGCEPLKTNNGQAIEVDGDNSFALQQYGLFARNRGDLDKAEEYLLRSLEAQVSRCLPVGDAELAELLRVLRDKGEDKRARLLEGKLPSRGARSWAWASTGLGGAAALRKSPSETKVNPTALETEKGSSLGRGRVSVFVFWTLSDRQLVPFQVGMKNSSTTASPLSSPPVSPRAALSAPRNPRPLSVTGVAGGPSEPNKPAAPVPSAAEGSFSVLRRQTMADRLKLLPN
jgi:hypothetical protein